MLDLVCILLLMGSAFAVHDTALDNRRRDGGKYLRKSSIILWSIWLVFSVLLFYMLFEHRDLLIQIFIVTAIILVFIYGILTGGGRRR